MSNQHTEHSAGQAQGGRRSAGRTTAGRLHGNGGTAMKTRKQAKKLLGGGFVALAVLLSVSSLWAAQARFVVQVRATAPAADVIAALGERGFDTTPLMAAQGLYRVSAAVDEATPATLSRLAARLDAVPGVIFAQPDSRCEGLSLPADPLAHLQWNIRAAGVPDAWAMLPADGEPVTVAVLDSGLAYMEAEENGVAHVPAESFANVEILDGWDAVNNDDRPLDDNGHGTMVASIMAAGVNDETGICGIAPRARLLPVKVLDAEAKGDESSLIAGILYAVNRDADIILMSLAFPPDAAPSPVLAGVISWARSRGVVLVAAAGNHGGDQVSFPAAFPGVIAVGASVAGRWTDADAPVKVGLADYSPVSAAIDIVAPGGSLTDDRNDDGLPDGIPAEGFLPGSPDDMGYFLFAGTSASAAHAAGAAALLLSAGANPDTIAALLHDGGFDIGDNDSEMRHIDVAGAVGAMQEQAGDLWADVSMNMDIKRRRIVLRATVTLMDADGRPVRHARVSGHWVGLPGADPEVADCRSNRHGQCRVRRVIRCHGRCIEGGHNNLNEGALKGALPLAGFALDRATLRDGLSVVPRGITSLRYSRFGVAGIASSMSGSGLSISDVGLPIPSWFATRWLSLRQLDMDGSGLSISDVGLPRIFLSVPGLINLIGFGSGLSISDVGLTLIDFSYFRSLLSSDLLFAFSSSLDAGRLAPLDALDAAGAIGAADLTTRAAAFVVPTDPALRLSDEALEAMLPVADAAAEGEPIRIP